MYDIYKHIFLGKPDIFCMTFYIFPIELKYKLKFKYLKKIK